LYDGFGAVQGVTTGDFGIDKDGQRKPSFAAGMEIRSKLTFLAEGCRGSLSEQAMKRFDLREKAGCDHQTYALGIKEVWKVDPSRHQPGRIFHSIGYPLPMDVYGGGWLYHMSDNRVSVGCVFENA
jgi:electron-transferring-flavoprotein dehydrogenase